MSEQAIPTGNFENKYATQNPIARRLVGGFLTSFDALAGLTRPSSIHEVGCGEGMLTQRLLKTGARTIRATDLTQEVFRDAQQKLPRDRFCFKAKSIYDLTPDEDRAELVVCCEVLEHLEDPDAGLGALSRLGAQHYLFSVPREPIWRALNMARGKYLGDLGNTPGHLNHWSQAGFCRFVSTRFEIAEIRSPFPWTMVLCTLRAAP